MSRPRIGAAPMSSAERQVRRRAWLRQQEEYRDWLDNLPPNLQSSALADKLQTILELDLEALQEIDPPRGYGRD